MLAPQTPSALAKAFTVPLGNSSPGFGDFFSVLGLTPPPKSAPSPVAGFSIGFCAGFSLAFAPNAPIALRNALEAAFSGVAVFTGVAITGLSTLAGL